MKIKVFVLACLVVVAAVSCKTVTRDNGTKTDDKSFVTGDIEKKYLAEGFIDKNIYRIVIVNPKNDGTPQSDIKSKSMKRAISSLEKFIQDSDKKSDANTRANLLRLMESNGSFYKKNVEKYANDVYYFDIKKDNIKKFILSQCPR